jgi:hypothetical protein
MGDRLRPWILAALAMAPYWGLYAGHFLRAHPQDGRPTGFLFPDMPYYAANGRAIFERGGGVFYPNAYDCEPDAPAIYFHWYVWLLGAAIVKFGIDPAAAFLGGGLVAGLLMSRLSLALVGRMVPAGGARLAVFLLLMWGGGLLLPAQVVANVVGGKPWPENPLRFDPSDGHWCLFWGRNLIYPTESLYHALVAGVWLLVISGRPLRAALVAGALAATHPFSGAETLAVLGAWWLARGFRRSNWSPVWMGEGLLIAALAGAFAAYNFGFLELYPQHRALRQAWSLDWNPEAMTQLFAYGPVALLAALRLARDGRGGVPPSPATAFLLLAAATALVCSNHHLFASPRQPLHFTRGYVWAPLFLIAAPMLAEWLTRMRPIAVALIVALASFDNVAFLAFELREGWRRELYLSAGEVATLREIQRDPPPGVVLSTSELLGFLLSTYAPVRVYFGHEYNTPDHHRKAVDVALFLARGKTGEWFEKIDAVAAPAAQQLPALQTGGWKVTYPHPDWVIYRRIR